MGADYSALQTQLVPQRVPICAIEPRFCLSRTVKLRIREKFWSLSGDDFKISDQSTGTVYFRCDGRAYSFREKKTLLDSYGVPVVNMKQPVMSWVDSYKIYAGNNSDKMICKFTTQLNFVKAKLYAQFTDVLTGQLRCLVLKGDWVSKVALVYLGEPKRGGIPIAKIFRPLTGRSICFGTDDYIIEIVSGVDISLVVMMCIALDEHKRD